jgi:5-methylcytosine-specific restriction endonuclease McrA
MSFVKFGSAKYYLFTQCKAQNCVLLYTQEVCMNRTLLLNSTYEPLHFISPWRAFTLVYKGKAEVVPSEHSMSVWNEELRTVSQSIKIPATIRMKYRINNKGAHKVPKFRKRVLFNRDGWKCQYCSQKLSYSEITIDHILPSSRGGPTSWTNCVACCKPCNKAKANKTPEEAQLKLLSKPVPPSQMHFWDFGSPSAWHTDWDTFIQK